MNWENCDDCFEEEKVEEPQLSGFSNNSDYTKSNEQAKAFQLQKYQHPSLNKERQKYLDLLAKFDELMAYQNHREIIRTLFTEDCEIFIFNMQRRDPVQYFYARNNLNSLHPGLKILKRQIEESYVDVVKQTVIQISICHVSYDDDQSEGDEAIFEIFSFRDNKISKYRVSFGVMTPRHGQEDPLEPSRKDKMLAKVKEINYAMADQPNLEKIASLLHEKTEYKIWSWDQKSFVFRKDNIAAEFRNMEENFIVKCIVPYEVYTEREYTIGTYVYHLENKTTLPGSQFVWLATAIYTFDKDANLVQVIQQGELFPEEDGIIPFEVFSRERIQQKVEEIVQNIKPGPDFFYNDEFQFDCDIVKFGAYKDLSSMGHFKGLNQQKELSEILLTGLVNYDWIKMIDLFIDFDDPSYDVAVLLNCAQGMLVKAGTKYDDKTINFLSLSRIAFENGKLAKSCQFFTIIPKAIPSPFDDPDFESINIIKKCILD